MYITYTDLSKEKNNINFVFCFVVKHCRHTNVQLICKLYVCLHDAVLSLKYGLKICPYMLRT